MVAFPTLEDHAVPADMLGRARAMKDLATWYPRFSSYDHPYCAQCDVPMRLFVIAPDLVDPTKDEIEFRCPGCGIGAMQIVLRGRH